MRVVEEEEEEEAEVTATSIESELVGVAGEAAGTEETSGAADGSETASSLTAAPGFGATATGGEGWIFASGADCATDETGLSVPVAGGASSDVGAGAGESSCGAEAAGAWAALVCSCCSSEVVVDEVNSLGVTTGGSEARVVDVAAVRARERVHRLPLTVVIDSWGVAMQKTES
jgi:hypothetical protein